VATPDIDAVLAASTVDRQQVDDVKRKLADVQHQLQVADDARRRAEQELSAMLRLDKARPAEPPKWMRSPRKASAHSGTPWLLLSDLHFDEVVDPAQIGGVNKYDRAIAEMRLRTTIEHTVKVCRDYWTGVAYDGIVVPLAGDLYAGDIHEELKHTNADTIMGSVLHWSDQLAAAMSLLADEFGKVHVPVVVGNHGRTTRKPMAKFRARTNWDWFTGHLLAREFRKDARVTFDIVESADALVQSYGHTVCVTHGDQVTGGSGIGGIWPPIMRLDARKRARYAAVQQPYDLLVMGHWHQLTWGPNFIINGSLVGYDEYAAVSNFGFQEPAQALWLMTPERGRTWMAPIYAQDRAREGW
jgi:predicted phosphodiesterase